MTGTDTHLLKRYIDRIKTEFSGYNAKSFSMDLMAGLTVTAVALPLALAFGVSCGADAAAGLITAIIAGLAISALSGASYQISGPTGAMTAVLITLVSQYSLQGVFVVGLLSGVILLACGVLKLGRLISIIPRPVITGFTSGIALIIALGQIDNFFGTVSEGESAIARLLSYRELGFSPNWHAVLIGAIVIAVMVLWPRKWNARVPSSLVGVVLATLASSLLKLDAAAIGEIPRTLLPQARLDFSAIDFQTLPKLVPAALTVAALGMIESLLCGASASRMKDDESFDADQELLAQGVGNIIIPFFGGVPATAAIARTSVAIKSGARTRLTGIIHALGLLASMFLLGGVMARIPYAALAGVLLVTAWRMNEWPAIRNIFKKRMKGAISKFLITMAATVIFDLTIAIIIGVVFAAFLFVLKSSNLVITSSKVRNDLLHFGDSDVEQGREGTTVIYINGPLFFANAQKLADRVHEELEDSATLIFSMRGVSAADTTGAEVMLEIARECRARNAHVIVCGLNDSIRNSFDRAGVTDVIGENAYFFSVDRALVQGLGGEDRKAG